MQTIWCQRSCAWVWIWASVAMNECVQCAALQKNIHVKYLSFVIANWNCAENWVVIEIETRFWLFPCSQIYFSYFVRTILNCNTEKFDLKAWPLGKSICVCFSKLCMLNRIRLLLSIFTIKKRFWLFYFQNSRQYVESDWFFKCEVFEDFWKTVLFTFHMSDWIDWLKLRQQTKVEIDPV